MDSFRVRIADDRTRSCGSIVSFADGWISWVFDFSIHGESYSEIKKITNTLPGLIDAGSLTAALLQASKKTYRAACA
jgi:hypothetical protein